MKVDLSALAEELNWPGFKRREKPMTKAVKQPTRIFFKSQPPTKDEPLFKSIAAGRPTRGDLAKAQEVLAAMRGKVPANQLAEMDIRLRLLAGGTL